ncbi:MAG: beta-ketoacyl synthase chain length factor [Verrucomicrobiales bacterium]|nr:beta-ketoacyl synthase chain length factor [Verrucomicrobiales bacterium]
MTAAAIELAGWGAVSPAGWSAAALSDALRAETVFPIEEERRSENAPAARYRRVPAWSSPPAWLRQPRLRRVSPISRYAVSAALEALQTRPTQPSDSATHSLGVIFAVQNGSVNFSRRFFSEVLSDPTLASPILFPETVFNAPSSHVSALLATPALNYTLVGDAGQFVAALDLAAQWLQDGRVSECLVVTAEENDWLSAEALPLFHGPRIASDGAAALWLRPTADPTPGSILLDAVTDAITLSAGISRSDACAQLRRELAPQPGDLLLSAAAGAPAWDAPHQAAWQDASVITQAIQPTLGHGFAVLGGWQCVAACEMLRTLQPAPQRALIAADTGASQVVGARFIVV